MAATALPSTGDRPEPAGCDTSDMLVIHGLLRSVYAEAPGLVKGVADGDADRAETVGKHLADIATALHNHHHAEDELLWDDLASRAPACGAHVGRMRAQHAAMGRHLEMLESALPAWRSTGAVADAAPVLAALDGVLAALGEHLGDEERTILPVAATAFTQPEWDRLGEHGRAAVPKDMMFIQLGYILDSLPEHEREKWKREFLPGPVRLLWSLLGRRQFLKHRAKLLGTV